MGLPPLVPSLRCDSSPVERCDGLAGLCLHALHAATNLRAVLCDRFWPVSMTRVRTFNCIVPTNRLLLPDGTDVDRSFFCWHCGHQCSGVGQDSGCNDAQDATMALDATARLKEPATSRLCATFLRKPHVYSGDPQLHASTQHPSYVCSLWTGEDRATQSEVPHFRSKPPPPRPAATRPSQISLHPVPPTAGHLQAVFLHLCSPA